MATDVTTNSQVIAREFAAAIRDEPAVEQLWLVEDPGCLQLIAITSDLDDATELRIDEAFGDLMRRHPAAGIFSRIFSPSLFEEGTDMVSLVPQRARQIPLCD
ncbi:MAG TPA: hypothetical protein VFV93_03740 [Thermomicrobiales bacterium]|nr:hypothetical protein [Thermomicrobiales bacterium]